MKRYSSYKDSGVEWIGEIPMEWEKTKLKYFSDFNNGFSYKSDDWVEEGIPVIRMSNIGSDGKLKITDNNLKYINSQIYLDTVGYQIQKGDVLISMTDMNPEMLWLGSTILFNEDGIWMLNQRVGNIRITSNTVDKSFYHYLSNTDVIRNQLKVSVYPNVQTNLSTEPIKNEIIFLPPLSEQQQIVSYLDEQTSSIDTLIQSKQKKITLLKEKRTSLINQIVTKGLNPNVEMKDSGVEWIGEIPRGWCVKKLKYISSSNEITLSNNTDPNYELEYIEISDVDSSGKILNKTPYRFEDSPSRCRRVLRKGDVFISTVRTYLKSMGYVDDEVEDLICSTGFCVLTPSEGILSKHLYYILGTEWFISSVISNSDGVSYPSIQSEKLISLNIVIPPLSEQQQIVEYLDKETELIDKTISIEERKIELLKEYKQSLISEVITGKRKVVSDE